MALNYSSTYWYVSTDHSTGNQLLSYKSLDSYRNFPAGWVGEVLVQAVFHDGVERRVIIGNVCQYIKHMLNCSLDV